MDYSSLPKVKLISYTRGSDESLGPQEISAVGALGCFEEKSSWQIWNEIREFEPERFEKRISTVIRESDGRGHEAVSDQNYFIFSIEDLTRAATLFLCGPEYLSHLQQSLRRATADRGYYLPKEILESSLSGKARKILDGSFEFYGKAVRSGVPKEDARNPLPLYTKTNIQTAGNARELRHLFAMSEQPYVPLSVKNTVQKMVSLAGEKSPRLFEGSGQNYEILAKRPSSQLFAETNKTLKKIIREKKHPEKAVLLSYSAIYMDEEQIADAIENRNEAELANLKHMHFEFLAPMSISCFHQATRQRTWNHTIESIYEAAERGRFVTPPTIKNSAVSQGYENQNRAMLELYNELLDEGVPKSEAVGVLPHSLEVYDLIHVDGWNAVHSIGKRTCTEAQWEIRGIAREMARNIKEKNPALGKYAEPQCFVYGSCPERNPCGYFKSRGA